MVGVEMVKEKRRIGLIMEDEASVERRERMMGMTGVENAHANGCAALMMWWHRMSLYAQTRDHHRLAVSIERM